MNRRSPLFLAFMAALALSGLVPGSVGASMANAQQPAGERDGTSNAGVWQPEADDQWLFELRTARLRVGDGVRGYANGANVCVILGDVITALDLPIRINPELRRATGWAFDERQTVLVDREAGRVTVASRSAALPAGVIVDTPEGWCVAPAALGAWIGVTLVADTANSVLRLETDRSLPFELAAQRRARAASAGSGTAMFSLADLPQARRDYALWQTPSVDVAASAAIVRDERTAQTIRQARYELFASGEALGLSFDARLSSDLQARPESLRVRAYRSDPAGGLLGPLQATHVAVGDVSGLASPLASQPAAGRGAVLTNRPLDLPDSFDRITLRGDLPVGWDAELYRNGQLIAFATPGGDGRYTFTDVQLLYGANRLEVVLYGPQGQIRREVRNIPVGMDAIPPQKTQYWVGVVQDAQDVLPLRRNDRPFPRGWRAMLGLERGLNRRTSVGLWATTLMIDSERYSIVDASVRRSIGPTLAEISLSGQNGGGYAGRLYWVGQ
ncbi:MAG: carboxypeptidase regulatory-like domain-containing protein, partial [Sphingopyxis sp.]|nr:carboxypeptidase regulatory-like domain-containing protein [Sphingopyxis sp.]